MAYREPTRAELEAVAREIMHRRGKRILAEEAAAKSRAEAERNRPPPDPTYVPTFEMGPPRLTERQVQELAAAYRAAYANVDEELRNLMEARLTSALSADGYKVPPMPAKDPLRELRLGSYGEPLNQHCDRDKPALGPMVVPDHSAPPRRAPGRGAPAVAEIA